MRINKLIAFTILLVAITNTSIAQVTIGSSTAPVGGAILQLKETTDKAANSTKGLLLPRVKLTNQFSIEDMEGAKDSEQLMYSGLMVYNVNTESCENIFPGVYIWVGTQWKGMNVGGLKATTFVDKRPNSQDITYRIAEFVAKDAQNNTLSAGTWMLDNLRATEYTDGTALTMATQKSLIDEDLAFYANPGYDATRPHEEGYFYSAKAALKGEVIEGLYNPAGSANQPDRVQQGICPDGWRVPTYEDWMKLFEVIEKIEGCDYTESKPDAGQIDFAKGRLINTPANAMHTSRPAANGGFAANATGGYYWNGKQDSDLAQSAAFATTYPSPIMNDSQKYEMYSPMYFTASNHSSQMLSSLSTTVAVRCVQGTVPAKLP